MNLQPDFLDKGNGSAKKPSDASITGIRRRDLFRATIFSLGVPVPSTRRNLSRGSSSLRVCYLPRHPVWYGGQSCSFVFFVFLLFSYFDGLSEPRLSHPRWRSGRTVISRLPFTPGPYLARSPLTYRKLAVNLFFVLRYVLRIAFCCEPRVQRSLFQSFTWNAYRATIGTFKPATRSLDISNVSPRIVLSCTRWENPPI